MKKIVLALTLVFAVVLGQFQGQTPNKIFSYVTPTVANEYYGGYDACEGYSGGYFIMGLKTNNGNQLGTVVSDVYPDGLVYQSVLYTSTANSFYTSYIDKASSNSWTMTGSIYDASIGTNYNGLMMNVAYNGTVNWAKAVTGQFSIYWGRSYQTSDGGYMYITSMNNSSQGADDIVLAKMTSTGSVSWSKYIGRSNNDGGPTFAELSNGNYALMFQSMNTSMEDEMVLMVLNPAGAEVTHKVFTKGTDLAFFMNDLIASDDRIYVAGAHDTGGNTIPFIMALDYNLNILFSKSYAANGFPNFAYMKINDGSLIVSGAIDGLIGGSDALMIRIDTANGSIVSTKAFGSTNNDSGGRIKLGTSGQMYMALGESNYNGTFTEEYQSVLIMDNSLTLGCNEATPFFTEGTYTPTTSSTTIGVSNVNISTSDVSSYISSSIENPTNNVVCSAPLCNMSISIIGGNDLYCNADNSGSLYVQVNNGGTGQIFSWTGPNAYTSSSQNITGLEAGTYDLHVVDGNGCEATFSTTLIEPAVLEIAASSMVHPNCNGDNNGSIDITINGGTMPYATSWSGPNSYISSTEDISGLAAGTYSLSLQDANNCLVNTSFTLIDPPALNISLSDQDVSCNGVCDGTITANVTGGSGSYTYAWTGFGETSSTLGSLCPGAFNYTVTVTDGSSCTISTNTNNENVTITEPTVLAIALTSTNSTCGDGNGTSDVVATGGTAPYNYSWTTGDNTASITGVEPGNYSVTVTDANSCTETGSFTVNDTVFPVEICVITVDGTSTKNEIVWEKPALGNIDGFNIYREVASTYTLIDFVNYDSLSQYVDSATTVNPNTTSYRYKITSLDTCGNESVMSAFHETIHLTVNQGTSGEANMIWDAYEGIAFTYYRIMRDTLLDGTWDSLDVVGPSNFTYTDWDVFSNGANYMIEIVIPFTCTATKAQDHNSTRSNRANISGGPAPSYIGENALRNAVVYPNPAKEQFTVSLMADNWEMSLFDFTGKLILHEQKTNNQATININDLETGVYMLQLTVNNQSVYKKIVKQ